MGRWKKIFFVVAVLCISIMMPARELPSLPKDKRIRTGTLENGIQYYLTASSAKKGFADILLVRKGEIPTEATRAQLRSLDGFAGTSPESFLTRNGIGAPREGYFEDRDGSTVFRFPDVPVYNRQVTDSTLLMTFALVAASPAPQAIIIAGDISQDDMLRRMGLFAMTVPYLHRVAVEDEYVWEPYLSPSFSLQKLENTDEALISVSYFAPRTPRHYLPTAQTLVMDIFAEEFEVVVKDRLQQRLQEGSVPFSTVDVDYLPSSETSGNVKYTISVGTDKDHIEAAMETVSRTVASLASFGVIREDFEDVRARMTPPMRRYARSIPSNGEYAHRCLCNYLYGASLAARDEQYQMFSRRLPSDTTGVAFFNRMSASFLNPSSNADIRYEAPLDSLDDLDVFFRYRLNYLKGSMMEPDRAYRGDRNDALSLVAKAPKVKIKTEGVEPLTGATVWTFSNGFRVFYSQVKDAPVLSYSFVFPAGYASADGLAAGEGGFFSDLLSIYNVGGISGDDLRSMLSIHGIEWTPRVGMASTTVSGTVPQEQVPLLLRAVVSLLEEGNGNPERFAVYAGHERLRLCSRRLSPYRTDARLYGNLHPGYAFTPYKDAEVLTPGLEQKAGKFFREKLFPSAAGGFLTLSGNMDPVQLKKVLTAWIGGLGKKAEVPARKSIRLPVFDGRVRLDGPEVPGQVRMMAECPFPITGKTWYMQDAVGEAVRRLAVTAAGTRARNLRTLCRFETYPQERLMLRITFDLVEGSAREVADDILRVLSVKNAVSKTDAEAYRAMVLSAAEASFQTPEGLNALVKERYGNNKDLKTRYKENINAITREDLSGAVSALFAGGWAEYAGQ